MNSREILKGILEGREPSFIKDQISSIADSHIKKMMFMEEEEPDKYDVQGTETDPALDPSMDREYFLKSFDEGDHTVTIKTIGVGRNKPVSVYINDVRWEMFPGPLRAEEETKKFIKSKNFEEWKGAKIAKQEEEAPAPTPEKPSEDTEEINKQEAEKPKPPKPNKKEEEPS